MMALLGSLLGFGSSFLPEVLSYFKANQVQKHRMEMMQLETQLAQKRSEMKLVELDKQADIAETKGLYEHDRSIDAGGFINALRGSVRGRRFRPGRVQFCRLRLRWRQSPASASKGPG